MTDRYAVIGHPISHSKSPLIHQAFAAQTQQDISYQAIEAPLDGFKATIERLIGEGYKGCNVTVPFKFEAYQLCDELGQRALDAKAVNTLVFRDGKILGTNTDGPGLVMDIQRNLGIEMMWKDVLLLGAGGAAAGVMWPLFNTGVSIEVANRNMDKARELIKEFEGPCSVRTRRYEDLPGRSYDIVINATSSGLRDELPPLPEGLFKPGALAYDMMYGRETPFMAYARRNGAAIVSDGLGMLVEQAAVAFDLWRGVRPETAPVIASLRA
jgi:shikimate dehydrogenase